MSRTSRHRWVAGWAIAVLASLCAAAPAAADTLHVTNTNDGGAGSLRDAMTQANAHPAHDDIVVDPGVTGTINLSSGLLIQSDMAIRGPGPNSLTVSGQHALRPFYVNNQPRGDATISGLKIADGSAYGNSGGKGEAGGSVGGGLIVNLGTLALDSTTLTGGLALAGSGGNGYSAASGGPGGNAYGGAIQNNGELTIDRSIISNNVAQGGFGGDAPPRGLFDGHAGEGGTGWGGAIWNQGTLTMRTSRVSGNTAAGGEGGDDRYADSRGRRGGEGNGGGIASLDGVATINDSTLDANVARGGPGPWGGYAQGGGLVARQAYLDGTTIAGNSVRGGDGGHNEKRGQTVLGGGVRGFGRLSLIRTTVSGNSVRGGDRHDTNSTIAGGGVAVAQGIEAYLMQSTVSGNSAETGGGIDARDGSTRLIIVGATIARNVATAGGAGAGASIANAGTTIRSVNTIVSANGGNCAGTALISTGFNLEDSNTCGFTKPTDKRDTDPQLADLADNGGPTKTHAIPLSSPALDQGTMAEFGSDQRRLERPIYWMEPIGPSDGADIGSYELQHPSDLGLQCEGAEATIVAARLTRGTNRADVIAGTGEPNDVHGVRGDDWICGSGGGDRLVGGRGADRVRGGDGDDRIQDLHGRNAIACGKGFDRVLTKRGTTVAANCERVRRRR